jgi:hypothetical protein
MPKAQKSAEQMQTKSCGIVLISGPAPEILLRSILSAEYTFDQVE